MAILEMESTLSARAGVDNLQFEFLVMLHNIDSIRSGMCKQRYLIKFVLLSKIWIYDQVELYDRVVCLDSMYLKSVKLANLNKWLPNKAKQSVGYHELILYFRNQGVVEISVLISTIL